MRRRILRSFTALLLAGLTAGSFLSAQVAETSGGRLRSLRDAEGTFQLNYENGALASQVIASEDNLVFRQFDGYDRVTSETIWDKDFRNIERETAFEYDGQRIIPLSETRWMPQSKQLVVITYTESGFVNTQKTYSGARNAEEADLTDERNWQYDSQNRLQSETMAIPGKKLTSRTDYEWHDGRKLPDERQYENNVLIRELVWLNDADYRERLFFDNGFEILSEYHDGLQVLEVVLNNDREIRRSEW